MDRIDNDGPYSEENCRWTTNWTQASNTRKNVLLTYKDKTQTISQWARELGLHVNTISLRIKLGLSEDGIFKPKGFKTPAKQTHNKQRKLYIIWRNMKNRCLKEADAGYKHYGARGITVCREWVEDKNVFFKWAESNGYSEGLSLDRIDVDGCYDEENCRWVTKAEQAKNKRSNIMLTYQGVTKCMSDWAKKLMISPDTLRDRIKRQMPEEDIFHVGKFDYRKLTYQSVTRTVSDWAKALKISTRTLRDRIKANMPEDKIFHIGKINYRK